jgi:hypothetical protein
LPISCASPSTLPSPAPTSGSARTFASSDSSNGGARAAAPLEVERRLAADDASSPGDVGEDRVNALVDRVGEDVRAADHRDAEHDRDRRQRRAQLAAEQAASANRSLPPSSSIAARMSCAELVRAPRTISPSRGRARGRRSRRARVVRDHHDRLAVARDRLAQQLEDLAARLRVEVAGRLVGEDDRRLRHERARDRDALLLAARELGRPVLRRSARPTAQQVVEEALSGFSPAIESGRTMFSSAVSIGSRLKNWKTKPMCSRRSCVSSLSSELGARAGDRDVAARRLVEAGEDVHERRLAGAGRPHDGRQLAFAHVSETPRSASTAVSPSP